MVRFPFRCSVAGVSFHQADVAQVRVGDTVTICSEPDNPHDACAKRVDVNGRRVGYLPKAIAGRLGGDDQWTGSVVAQFTVNSIAGIEIEVLEACATTDTTPVDDTSVDTTDAATIGTAPVVDGGRETTTVASNANAPTRTARRRPVYVKRSGRLLGHLVAVERDQRRVLVATDTGVVAYPDGLIDIGE